MKNKNEQQSVCVRITRLLNVKKRTPTELSNVIGIKKSHMTERLRKLRKYGIVTYKKQGVNRIYSLIKKPKLKVKTYIDWDGMAIKK